MRISTNIPTLAAFSLGVGILLTIRAWTLGQQTKPFAHEPFPVGTTREAQERNAALLSGYEYDKYPVALTGFTGQDLQRIGFVRWQEAVRTRLGPRGSYKAGLARLTSGKLVIAVCRDNNDPDPARNRFLISVYESADQGLTWQQIGKTPLLGKEPSLTALPDGSLLLTAAPPHGYVGPGGKQDVNPISRSADGGRTWETTMIPSGDIPRNVMVEPDGSLLWVRPGHRPNLQLVRSTDGGKTWQFSEGLVPWEDHKDYEDYFGEVSAIRFRNGRLLAALRRQIPGTWGEGYEDTVLTESTDGGKHWSKPLPMGNAAEVHAYLTELNDSRILATYSNYHLPWGVFAVISSDGGTTWDLEHPIQLALSAGYWVGWPVTLQLPDGGLITSYASTSYLNQPPDRTTCEVVRWRLP